MSLDWRTVDPDLLEPRFRDDVTLLLAESPFHWVVTHGYRTIEEQAELYRRYKAGGPLAAPPGKSAHNYGLAIDVVFDSDPSRPGLQVDWNTRAAGWAWLKAATLPHPRLQNGWSFGDWPHIQRYRWRNHTGWQRP
jgi:hypothetical protein